jgi:uncharacterized protein
MEWFDCNVSFGIPTIPPVSFAPTAEGLLEEMDFCGIAEALVCHAATREGSAQRANQFVVAETTGLSRLHPVWAILPPQTGEIGTVADWLGAMKAHQVQALIACPEKHRYLLNGVTFGPLFEEMSARGLPLILQPNWSEVASLLADFPRLTVMVVNHSGWGQDRFFRPLMQRYERCYIDTASYDLDGGIADLVSWGGPERLLYGSGFPAMQMGASLLTVAQAAISDEAKAAIASGNLRRLLSEVKL